MSQFALFKYNTTNLGDEIQSLAALQYLPTVDRLLDRDFLQFVRSSKPLNLICNGWFLHNIGLALELRLRRLEKSNKNKVAQMLIGNCIQAVEKLPMSWPPAACINPLLISMHFSTEKKAFEKLTVPKFRRYYEKAGPIGCRDLFTLRILRESGVEAFYSGCLTLTFQPQNEPRTEQIFFVDVPGANQADSPYMQQLPKSLRDRVILRTHLSRERSASARFNAAIDLLLDYARAAFVVTSRLHCALPCLALGTPVILVRPDDYDPRFEGLEDFIKRYNLREFKEFALKFSWNEPFPSGAEFQTLAGETRDRVQTFVSKASQSAISPYNNKLSDLRSIIESGPAFLS